MDVSVDIKGLDGLEDALANAGAKVAKASIRKGLNAAGDILVAAAKERAPVLKEATANRQPGDLRDSITKTVKLSPKEESGVVHVGPEYHKADKQQSPGVWGMFEELGSENNPPQPYLRPAMDAEAEHALQEFQRIVAASLEKLGKKA